MFPKKKIRYKSKLEIINFDFMLIDHLTQKSNRSLQELY